jgi:hypothetical protein
VWDVAVPIVAERRQAVAVAAPDHVRQGIPEVPEREPEEALVRLAYPLDQHGEDAAGLLDVPLFRVAPNDPPPDEIVTSSRTPRRRSGNRRTLM